ncbi:hypothetical protein [Serratia fonticola]|jgi:hypothetical protein|uniref:F4 family fimbrial subunit n=1 Tax=Serratia fonticola TaxID=47917 RepID=UPI001415568B|nr:hypothetical protein [Serratia fonticola]QIP90032.1 hypothetical protein HAP32_00549 [Serratia fonticola]
MKLSHVTLSLALACSLSGGLAQAATGAGAIGHDIKFGGIIAENPPKWVWTLPQRTIRIDLKDDDGVVANSTKTWNVLQNRQPYRFLEGYMTATVPGLALTGLNMQVTYLQDSVTVTPTTGNNNQTVLALKAIGNKDSTPVNGTLKLTLSQVLLLAQAAQPGDAVLDGKVLAGTSVTAPEANATEALVNAKTKLESQLSTVSATSVNYSTSGSWPANSLADGTPVTIPSISGYASTISAADLSFPSDSPVSSWQSVITVQVQYI